VSVIKDKNGKWLVHIERKGFKRVRRTFLTKKEADQFERDYLSVGLPLVLSVPVGDRRRITDLVESWYQYHGMNLSDGKRRRDKLDAIAYELGNPVATELSKEAFVVWRYGKLQAGLSKKTCNNLHGYLAALFSTLLKLKVIQFPPPPPIK
jgi:hypothetical protein